MNDTELSKLLRLKRYERPDENYFNGFLSDFQRRQRAELLQRPSWQIAIDRMQAFFGEAFFSRLSYATATVAVLIFAGVTTMHNLSEPPEQEVEERLAASALPKRNELKLESRPQTVASNPHYIMDARPVSYEPSYSF